MKDKEKDMHKEIEAFWNYKYINKNTRNTSYRQAEIDKDKKNNKKQVTYDS